MSATITNVVLACIFGSRAIFDALSAFNVSSVSLQLSPHYDIPPEAFVLYLLWELSPTVLLLIVVAHGKGHCLLCRSMSSCQGVRAVSLSRTPSFGLFRELTTGEGGIIDNSVRSGGSEPTTPVGLDSPLMRVGSDSPTRDRSIRGSGGLSSRWSGGGDIFNDPARYDSDDDYSGDSYTGGSYGSSYPVPSAMEGSI